MLIWWIFLIFCICLNYIRVKWSKIRYKLPPAVILSDPRHIRKAFTFSTFSCRPNLPIVMVRMGFDGKKRGLIFNEDSNWSQQRKFTIRQLREFGFGKNSMEVIMLNEIAELKATINNEVGQAVSTEHMFNAAVINTIWAVVAGERFQSKDPLLTKLVSCVCQNIAETPAAGLLTFFPTLSIMFPNLSGWNKYLESFQTTHDFIYESIQNRIKTRRPGEVEHFIDAYLEEIQKTENTKSSFYGEEGLKNLLCVLDDLFSAGGETTSTALTWVFLCLARNQEVQKNLHDEIDVMVGQERLPSLKDRPSMPFTVAIILEVLRIASVVPLGLGHSVSEDTLFEGFLIRKGTLLFANIYAAHNSEEWKDPTNFRPDRFLQNGILQKTNESFLAFSSGKRLCLGEVLAMDELFLFTTSLLQSFDIILDPNSSALSLEPIAKGLVAKPFPHKLIFNPRNK